MSERPADRMQDVEERLEHVLHPSSYWSYREEVQWLMDEVKWLRETYEGKQ